ncbi:MAG: potassium channel protein [Actinomycetota bacterium]|nr:potassium channel protein [Actinomycetota bacterium]
MPKRRITYGLGALAVIVVIGTIGYVFIEGVSLFDAFYMVVISITTVGFAEVFSLSDLGRLWTLLIVVSGFGIAIYTAVATVEYLVDIGETRRRLRMQNQAARLNNHVIVCGFGRVGLGTWTELTEKGVDVVVIESEADRVQAARAVDAIVITGDATHNDVLELAGVHSAKALIACVADDSDNLVIALSVKALRPELRVICRATEQRSERKLRLAGADAVVAPQAVGAERLALMAIQPELAQIVDVVIGGNPVEFHVEELDITHDCAVDGMTLRKCGIREATGAMVLAVEGDEVVVNPGPETPLNVGDRLVVVGTRDQVDKAAKFVQTGA